MAAEVEGRTIGAALVTPALAPGPALGRSTRRSASGRVSGDRADVGSVLVYWFADGHRPRDAPERQPAASGRQGPARRPRGPTARPPTRWRLAPATVDLRRRVRRRPLHHPGART